jgi:hypothetical protein
MKKISVSFAVPVLLALAGCGQSPTERAAENNEQAAPAAAAETAPAAAPAAAPAVETPADKYEGKVVRRPSSQGGKQDGWFYVTEGKRYWIVDSGWLKTKNLTAKDVIVITPEELQAIPEDAQALSSPKPAAGG